MCLIYHQLKIIFKKAEKTDNTFRNDWQEFWLYKSLDFKAKKRKDYQKINVLFLYASIGDRFTFRGFYFVRNENFSRGYTVETTRNEFDFGSADRKEYILGSLDSMTLRRKFISDEMKCSCKEQPLKTIVEKN